VPPPPLSGRRANAVPARIAAACPLADRTEAWRAAATLGLVGGVPGYDVGDDDAAAEVAVDAGGGVAAAGPAAPRLGVEVGVWRDSTATATLAACPNLLLTLADPWRHLEGWNKPLNVDDGTFAAVHAEALAAVPAEALTATLVVHDAQRVGIARGTSVACTAGERPEALDFVMLDGDHTLGGALGDLIAWWRKARAGALILGDDCVDGHQHDERYALTRVRSAVDLFARAVRREAYVISRDGLVFALVK
jgi:hypothetical protein